MQDFIYRFEFEDPRQAELNRAMGDHEEYQPGYLKIRANTRADALAWGKVLADWLVMHLFGDPKPGRWSQTIGADELWDSLPRHRPPLLDRIWASRPIAVGEYPDLHALLDLLNLHQ